MGVICSALKRRTVSRNISSSSLSWVRAMGFAACVILILKILVGVA